MEKEESPLLQFKKKYSNSRVFVIHFNGDEPFLCVYTAETGELKVFLELEVGNYSGSPVLHFKSRSEYKKIYFGTDYDTRYYSCDISKEAEKRGWDESNFGSNILIHIGGNDFIRIQYGITHYNLPDEYLLDFYCPMGYDDVPIAILTTTEKVYSDFFSSGYPSSQLF